MMTIIMMLAAALYLLRPSSIRRSLNSATEKSPNNHEDVCVFWLWKNINLLIGHIVLHTYRVLTGELHRHQQLTDDISEIVWRCWMLSKKTSHLHSHFNNIKLKTYLQKKIIQFTLIRDTWQSVKQLKRQYILGH